MAETKVGADHIFDAISSFKAFVNAVKNFYSFFRIINAFFETVQIFFQIFGESIGFRTSEMNPVDSPWIGFFCAIEMPYYFRHNKKFTGFNVIALFIKGDAAPAFHTINKDMFISAFDPSSIMKPGLRIITYIGDVEI